MKFFFNKIKIFALGLICLIPSFLHASCPVPCTGATGAARFCNLTVTGVLSAGTLCVQGNEQVNGNLAVCGTTTSFVSVTGGTGLTGPISFATLAAFGFAFNTGLDQGVTAGNNTVDLTNSSSLSKTTFAPIASALIPQISGTYLIHYIIDQTSEGLPAGTFSIFVDSVEVDGSQFEIVNSSQIGAAAGQALASVTAGQPVRIIFAAETAGTIIGSASLTLEKVG